jgi:trimeric autotransporter adhesin
VPEVQATAIGLRATTNATALGAQSLAAGEQSTAIGTNAIAIGANSVAIGNGAAANESNSVAIGNGSVANEPNSVSVGTAGNERTITNVAPGVNPTDAVNVSQLQGVQQSVNNVAKNAYTGSAMAGALAALPQVEPGKTVMLGAGLGNYGGYTALALGGSARVTANTIVKFGVSTVNGDRMMVNAGVGYSW